MAEAISQEAVRLRTCEFCGSPIPKRDKTTVSEYRRRRFCSHRCAATRDGRERKSANVPRCVCMLPLLPGERICELCRLEGLDQSDPEVPSRRWTRISTPAHDQVWSMLLSWWFLEKYPSREGMELVGRTWLDDVLDRRQPVEIEEEVA